jgi:hypothetical protein
MATMSRSMRRVRDRQPAKPKPEPHSRTRIALGVALTAATAAMTSIATQTDGTFWSKNAWVAWTLLGLLIVALAINELPAIRAANYWLAVLVALGLALSVALWVSVRNGAQSPLDGTDISAFMTDPNLTYPPGSSTEAIGYLDFGGREIGDLYLNYDYKDRIVWGQYMNKLSTGLQTVTVDLAVTRSTDGKTETPGSQLIITSANLTYGNETSMLEYQPAAHYTVTSTLIYSGKVIASARASWNPSAS